MVNNPSSCFPYFFVVPLGSTDGVVKKFMIKNKAQEVAVYFIFFHFMYLFLN